MLGEGGTPLSRLQAAVREFQAREERRVDPKTLRGVIDALEGEFAAEVREAQRSSDHLIGGNMGPATWIGLSCGMSVNSASDRLCVGEQLESLPKISAALSAGEISYQAVSLLCHLRDNLEDKKDLFDEEDMLDRARWLSFKELQKLCRIAWHVCNPDGFFNEAEADFSRRRLHISRMADGMHVIDGVLDPVTGSALRKALEPLAKRQGPEDDRKHSQRMVDAVGELVEHALDQGAAAAQWGQAPRHRDDDAGRLEERGRRTAGGRRALASIVDSNTGAHLLRLHHLPRPACRLHGGRCRPGDEGDFGADAKGAGKAGSRLPLARLRPSGQLVDATPHRRLGERWTDSPRQPCSSLLFPSSARP